MLADFAKNQLEDMIDALIDEGYATVDIQHILVEEISVMVLDKRWGRNTNLKRQKEKCENFAENYSTKINFKEMANESNS